MLCSRLLFESVYDLRLKYLTSFVWKRPWSSRRIPKTAGIIVIGDEILKGQVADTNSYFIARHMFELGVKVVRISVVGDDKETISNEVHSFSKQFTYVLTTGGIGPTHDDITFEAIANAFDEPLHPHPELVKICSEFYKTKDLDSPAMKLVHVPASAKLNFGFDKVKGRRTLYPNVSVRNVYIFPGIPSLMERLFIAVYKDLFGNGNGKFFVKNLYLSATEMHIANELNAVVAMFPNVTFGSYPKWLHRYYAVQLTVQSDTEEETQRAYDVLQTTLPAGSIVDYDSNPLQDAHRKIEQLIKAKQNINLQDSMHMIENLCIKYKPEELCVYFNGGKESTATLHLLHACTRKHKEDFKIQALHVVHRIALPEVEPYIKEAEERYNLSVEILQGPLESVLGNLFSQRPGLKVVVFGCLNADCIPGELQAFTKASSERAIEWLNPLQKWRSTEVWDFIRSLYLPYCIVYDKGYTSIVSSIPNQVSL